MYLHGLGWTSSNKTNLDYKRTGETRGVDGGGDCSRPFPSGFVWDRAKKELARHDSRRGVITGATTPRTRTAAVIPSKVLKTRFRNFIHRMV